MKKIYIFALVALLLFTGCSNSLAARVAQYQKDVRSWSEKWRKDLNSAWEASFNTPHALNPAIELLHADRLDFMALVAPEPLTPYRGEMNEGMMSTITGFDYTMHDDIEHSRIAMDIGNAHFSAGYEEIMAYQVTP